MLLSWLFQSIHSLKDWSGQLQAPPRQKLWETEMWNLRRCENFSQCAEMMGRRRISNDAFNNKSVTWTAKMSLFDVFLQRARDEWGPRFFPCCIIIFWGQTAEQRRWWWWRRRGRGWGWGVSEAASLVEGRFGRCFEHERRHWPFWSDFFSDSAVPFSYLNIGAAWCCTWPCWKDEREDDGDTVSSLERNADKARKVGISTKFPTWNYGP